MDKELKMLAIQQMVNVYRDADKVLVFDATLSRISVEASPAECLTAIEISGWMQRLWTIQEAAFAKQLYFQFKDGASKIGSLLFQYRMKRFERLCEVMSHTNVDGHGLWTLALARQLLPGIKLNTAEETVEFEGDRLANDIPDDTELTGLQLDDIFYSTSLNIGSLYLLRFPRKGVVSRRETWDWLQKTIPNRQTSMKTDETLCIGAVLGMDVSTLYSLTDDERVARILKNVGTVQSGVIFGRRQRLSQSGCTWMPSTFVSEAVPVKGSEATITEKGLQIEFPGGYLDFPPKGFLIGRNFGFTVIPANHSDSEDKEISSPGYLLSQTFGLIDPSTTTQYVIELDIEEGGCAMVQGVGKAAVILEATLGSKAPLHGVLVAPRLKRDSSGGILADYAVSLFVRKIIPKKPLRPRACAVIRSLAKDQKWIIS